jgi:hypothetical protein
VNSGSEEYELSLLSYLNCQVYQANSPNGRFADGAAAINGHVLSHIEAHGKHIFYVSFCSSCSCVVS